MSTGYSGKPLYQKLGYKEGMRVMWVDVPENYNTLLKMPSDLLITVSESDDLDLVHIFGKDATLMKDAILSLSSSIKKNGMIWVSWPKKSSKVPTDIIEDTIRDFALENKLVDVKVCAVDEIWSALKLVIPVKFR